MPLDVVENEDEYVVRATLPGVNPDDLEITYNNNTLTIKGEVKQDEEKTKNARYHIDERRYGSFQRSISLPTTIKADAIQASYDSGILHLRLPKTEEVKPRRIPIQAGAGHKTIEATSTNSSKR
jgi:HSP20 family protein